MTTHLLHIFPVLAACPDGQHHVDDDAAADEDEDGEVVAQLGAEVRVGGGEVDRVGRSDEVAGEGGEVVAEAVDGCSGGERGDLGKRGDDGWCLRWCFMQMMQCPGR